MQQILKVITPASSQDLISLVNMKQMLQIPPTNTASDAMLQALITNTSETIAVMCNRVFGYETVDETFYQLEDEYVPYQDGMITSPGGPLTRRLYLSRWPVVLVDITSITQDGNDISSDEGTSWILEEETGTLYMLPNYAPWCGVIDVQYSGGYQLPDDAPGPLKFALAAVTREGYAGWMRAPGLYGVRQIAHKDSRVGYYDPNLLGVMGMPSTWANVKNILNKYIRYWV
jgi:hypothetical protein